MRATVVSFLLLLAACGSDPFNGSWQASNTSTTSVQNNPVSLSYQVNFTFASTNNTVTMVLKFSAPGSDTLTFKGTYKDTGTSLTLDFNNLVAGPGDTSPPGVGSNLCVAFAPQGEGNLVDSTFCVVVPQTNAYQNINNVMSTTLDYTWNGTAATPLVLNLSKQ